MLCNAVVTAHRWLFKFQVVTIKYNSQSSSSVTVATFHILGGRMWLWLDSMGEDLFVIIESSSTDLGSELYR